MGFYNDYIDIIYKGLKNIIVSDKDGNCLGFEEGMSMWCAMTESIYSSERTIYLVGNGASSAMASHMSADMTKNGGIRCMTFNDAALLTAVSNDTSFEYSYEMPLKRFSIEGDMLITISSSGDSLNVINALKAAKDRALKTITLSGMKKDNKSRRYGDLNFYIPLDEYGPVEACHQTVLHCWLDKYIKERGCAINEKI